MDQQGRRVNGWMIVAIVAGAVAVVFAVVAAGLGVAYQRSVSKPPVTVTATPCTKPVRVSVDFDTDEAMRSAGPVVRADPRAGVVTDETKQQNFARARELFKNDPKVLEQLTPDALPATLTVTPKDGTSVADLAGGLKDEVKTAQAVRSIEGPC